MSRFRFATIVGLVALAGCATSMPETKTNSGKRDINAVLAAHDKRLIAMPGVAGVYVGLLDDGVTQCLKVMLVRRDPTLEQALPRELEGYRVVTEVTGEIRPLGAK
jgi:hypothetical protein